MAYFYQVYRRKRGIRGNNWVMKPGGQLFTYKQGREEVKKLRDSDFVYTLMRAAIKIIK